MVWLHTTSVRLCCLQIKKNSIFYFKTPPLPQLVISRCDEELAPYNSCNLPMYVIFLKFTLVVFLSRVKNVSDKIVVACRAYKRRQSDERVDNAAHSYRGARV